MDWPDLPDTADAEQVRDWYRDTMAGTHRSNWAILRESAASSLFVAAQHTSSCVTALEGGRAKGVSDEEAWVILGYSYSLSAIGPLLSAVLLPAFCIEAFARSCAERAILEQDADVTASQLAIAGYDRLPAEERLDAACELTGSESLNKQLRRSIKDLLSFRNATVHDIPMHQTADGELVSFKRGKAKRERIGQAHGGTYPVLHNEALPLRLSHGLAAAECHDSFVDHILTTADDDFRQVFWASMTPEFRSGSKITAGANIPWERIRALSNHWDEEVMLWYESVSRSPGLREYLNALNRRKKIKVVPIEKEIEPR